MSQALLFVIRQLKTFDEVSATGNMQTLQTLMDLSPFLTHVVLVRAACMWLHPTYRTTQHDDVGGLTDDAAVVEMRSHTAVSLECQLTGENMHKTNSSV